MSKHFVLMVEDHYELASTLCEFLEEHHFVVDHARNIDAAKNSKLMRLGVLSKFMVVNCFHKQMQVMASTIAVFKRQLKPNFLSKLLNKKEPL